MSSLDPSSSVKGGSRSGERKRSIWSRTRSWMRSRVYWLVLMAVPALTAGALWTTVIISTRRADPARLRATYQHLAQDSLLFKNWRQGRVVLERLLRTTSGLPDPDLVFKLAQVLGGLGKTNDSTALIMSLAPLNGKGYPPAHMAVARGLLSQPPSASTLDEAETHIKRVVALRPNDLEAESLLGSIDLMRGNWDGAYGHFQKVVVTDPGVSLQLASIELSRGRKSDSQTWAERAMKYYRTQADLEPSNQRGYGGWAESLLLLGQFSDALKVADRGVRDFGREQFGPLASRICCEWEASLNNRQEKAVLRQRFEILQAGFAYWPANPDLIKRFLALSRLKGEENGPAAARVRELLAEGSSASAILHTVLGVEALKEKNAAQAQVHFELAYQLGPQMPAVLNNMAIVLIQGDKPDPQRAFELIDPLIKKFPGSSAFRETRGQVLLKLERWRDAITDLQQALDAKVFDPQTHAALAHAYSQMGMPDMAAQHTRLSGASLAPK